MYEAPVDSEIYAHLKRLASRLGGTPAATLNPTSLVHEAWEKLAKGGFEASDRLRQITRRQRNQHFLIEHAAEFAFRITRN